jgi:sugar/nucleoside kinase (ribokinase family)
MKVRKIIAIGELLIDAITSDYVEDLSKATTLQVLPGGSPANFVRFSKACGTDALIIASVGNDGLGKILLSHLEANGIDTKYIFKHDTYATSAIVVAKTKGTPDFIPLRNADQFIQTIDMSVLEQASLLHTSAFALSTNPARSYILEAFKNAFIKGIPVSVDWNYSEKIWLANDMFNIFNLVQQYKPLIKFSIDDVSRMHHSTISVNEAKQFIDSVTATLVCLTCGSEGVHYKYHNEWYFKEALPVEVKDATGAGDAFWAGFVSHWLQQEDIHGAVDKGIATASKRLQGQL